MLHLVAWIASCAIDARPGKPMDVPVQLKNYKGQEDEVYDKALKKGASSAWMRTQFETPCRQSGG